MRRHPDRRQRDVGAVADRAGAGRRIPPADAIPVVLGGGKRLFADDGELRNLKLVESKPAGDSLILRCRLA